MAMEIELQIKMNAKLYVKNPEQSDLGRKIIKHSIELIYQQGFEAFTFKKLAETIGTTEAGIYRYFENKHRLLIYIVAWYWRWLEYQAMYRTNNITEPAEKLRVIIKLLASTVEDDIRTSYVNENLLHQIVITEGSKTYLTKRINEDNKDRLFKPYKDLCAYIADIITECSPAYAYPKSLASTIIEMAHYQNFFMHHLPALTDFGQDQDEIRIIAFLEQLTFSAITPKASV